MTPKTAVQTVSFVSDRVLVSRYIFSSTPHVLYCTWCNVMCVCCRRFQVYGSQRNVYTKQAAPIHNSRTATIEADWAIRLYYYSPAQCLGAYDIASDTKQNQNIIHTNTRINVSMEHMQTQFVIEQTHGNDVDEVVTTRRPLRSCSRPECMQPRIDAYTFKCMSPVQHVHRG